MQVPRPNHRALVLALSLLASSATLGCLPARAEPAPSASPAQAVYANFLAGQFAASQYDSDHASRHFLDALAAQPRQPELVRQAFVAALMSGRSEAMTLAPQVPGNQAAQLMLADQALRAGNWPEAERQFKALPDGQVVRPILIAWAQAAAGHEEQALETLRPLAQGPRFRGVYALHAGLIAELAGRSADADSFYRQAIEAYGGGNLRLAQIVASFQARQGHQAEAMRTLASVSASVPELGIALPGLDRGLGTAPVANPIQGIAEAYLAVAGTLDQQNSPEYALLLLRLSLDLRPGFTPARLLMVDILTDQHHPEFALREIASIPADDPLIPVVRLRHAEIVARLGDTDRALAELGELARDYPSSFAAERELGDVLRGANRYTDAIAAYDRALARAGASSSAEWSLLYARGVAYERAHEWPRAEADFQRSLALAPSQPAVLNYLGYSWADMGVHLAEARQMIEKAAQMDPGDGAVVDSLGWVMLRQGQVADAVRTLEHAAELEPSDATVNAHLGDAYWAAGRKLEAGYQWRHALTLHPEPADVERIESRLHDMTSQAADTTAPTRHTP